jgi:hypothetical protein
MVDQVSAGGEQAAVAVLLGHGRGGELDQGDGEHPTTGQFYVPSSIFKYRRDTVFGTGT